MSSCSGRQSPKGTWVAGTDQQRADCCRILRGTGSEGTFITSQLEAPSLLQHFPELLPTGLAQLHPLRKSTHRGEALWAMKMIMDSDLEDRGGTKGSGRALVAAGARRAAAGSGEARRRQPHGPAPRPPARAGRTAPSAPRAAQTEQPPLQCQQPQRQRRRRRRRERQRPGPRGSGPRGTARPGGRARPEPAAPFAASGARRPALRAPARRSDSKPAPAAAAHKGPRTPGSGDRPGGTDHRAARPPRLRFPGGRSRSPNPSRPHHMTAATQRPARARAARSPAPRPPAPGVARAAPR
ncbi:hypothetical protein R6Z07F_014810 [Ovis aries]